MVWDFLASLISPSILLLSSGSAWICCTVAKVVRARQSIGNLPGEVNLFAANELMSNMILPRIPFIAAGKNHLIVDKYKRHKHFGCSVYSQISLWPFRVHLVVSDPAAIKEIVGNRAKFPKPIELYEVLACFGRNIVASEGEQWKKYRKISAPAFSEACSFNIKINIDTQPRDQRNSRLVWDASARATNGLIDLWSPRGEKSITVEHAVDITLPITLSVIGEAGFGCDMSWVDTEIPEGHQMTFANALRQVSRDVWLKVSVPEWAMGTTERTRATKLAFDELLIYMKEMIQDRITGDKASERYDLLSSLLDSNSLDVNPDTLDEAELIGNIFIFLLAGHETSAHTLSFALALLALHQDKQECFYWHIKSACPDDHNMAYTDMHKLTYALSILHETMRLLPSVPHIPKKSAEDTTLPATLADGEVIRIPVPRGTYIVIDTPGIHSNPHYWASPEKFIPERFLEDYDKDAFIPFSAGVRSCLGRKFAETQIVAALTTLVQNYKVTVKEEPQFAHETLEQREKRILRTNAGLTTTPVRIPLVFTKRD